MSSLRVLWTALLLLVVAVSSANASTGVRVIGDPKFRTTAEARVGTWLASHGHDLTEKALGEVALAGVDECYLGNALDCANKIFVENSEADLFLYVNLEVAPSAARDHNLRVTLWLLKHTGTPQQWQEDCSRCDDESLETLIANLLANVGTFEKRLGVLHLTTDPVGATVVVDGKPAGNSPVEVELHAGAHTLAITSKGFVDEERTVQIIAGQRAEETVALRRLIQPPPRWRRPAMIGAASVGAASVVAGIVALAINEGHSCGTTKKECLYSLPHGIAFLSAGGVLLGVSGYLWLKLGPAEAPVAGIAPRRTYLVGWTQPF
jgi:PEGA domain